MSRLSFCIWKVKLGWMVVLVVLVVLCVVVCCSVHHETPHSQLYHQHSPPNLLFLLSQPGSVLPSPPSNSSAARPRSR